MIHLLAFVATLIRERRVHHPVAGPGPNFFCFSSCYKKLAKSLKRLKDLTHFFHSHGPCTPSGTAVHYAVPHTARRGCHGSRIKEISLLASLPQTQPMSVKMM